MLHHSSGARVLIDVRLRRESSHSPTSIPPLEEKGRGVAGSNPVSLSHSEVARRSAAASRGPEILQDLRGGAPDAENFRRESRLSAWERRNPGTGSWYS